MSNPIGISVPQGSILGPILYLIYINNIVQVIQCHIKIFANDTSIYILVEDEYEAADLRNRDR